MTQIGKDVLLPWFPVGDKVAAHALSSTTADLRSQLTVPSTVGISILVITRQPYPRTMVRASLQAAAAICDFSEASDQVCDRTTP
jgi:hypothetical protein